MEKDISQYSEFDVAPASSNLTREDCDWGDYAWLDNSVADEVGFRLFCDKGGFNGKSKED